MLTGEVHTTMHPLKGKRQTREHVLKRIAASPPMQPVDLAIRFMRMTDRLGECWIWKGKEITNTGVPRMEIRGKRMSASRAAYAFFNGPIPNGLSVLHRCDQPFCMNPAHLFVGTQSDNIADAVAKGRNPKGERHGMAQLTANDVLRIRASHLSKPILAEIFGVHPGHIKSIRRGRVWRHLL